MTQTYNYNAAQICEKGHLITGQATEHPEWKKSFCDQCGAKTLTACRHCKNDIRGIAIINIPSFYEMPVPSSCEHCGRGFPWTGAKFPKLPKIEWKRIFVAIGSLGTLAGFCYNIGPIKEAADKQIGSWLHIPQVSAPAPQPILTDKPKS